ncbi:MAG: Uma2 family endonuclease [Gemmatimonadales bacterium]|jgi:Uma2 family endonuclease
MSITSITWREAQLMPEDGKRYEAVGGKLYVTAAPSWSHQRVSGKMFLALVRLLEEPGHGWVGAAPLGVEFPDSGEGVQPDLLFVSRQRADRLVPEGIRGAPDLLVEILSPSTAERDRTIKRELYQRRGARVYWMVDPDEECVDVCDFESGANYPVRFRDRLPVRLGGRSFGTIALDEIFAPES